MFYILYSNMYIFLFLVLRWLYQEIMLNFKCKIYIWLVWKANWKLYEWLLCFL